MLMKLSIKLKLLIPFALLLLFTAMPAIADYSSVTIGRLKYSGGSDWYSNPSSLPNLLQYFATKSRVKVTRREKVVSLSDSSFKTVPVIYFTGHGRFMLTDKEKDNLRWYLKNGGFLFADDNFGMDVYIRKELNSLFKGTRLQRIPVDHSIFKTPFKLAGGLPKIHKHYGGPPEALGLFLNGRMVAFYGYNTDLGDGWEDLAVHNDGEVKHELALKMGVNVLYQAMFAGLYKK